VRWIDQDRIELPDGWFEKAAEAKRKVMEDGVKPDDLSEVWQCLKGQFGKLTEKRCWICESRVARSDNAIDHFRPKNRVAEAKKGNTGYKWLAFEFSNFRYSCTFCNSRRIDREGGTDGGKADHFPLRDEKARAYCFDDDVDNEEPILLDPCDEGDWKLLGCSVESGAPVSASTNEHEAARVNKSIELYHLHQDALNKLRLSQIRDLDQKISSAKDRYDEIDGSAKRTKKYKDALKPILRLISPGSDFSGEMYNHLKKRRVNDHPWLQDLLG